MDNQETDDKENFKFNPSDDSQLSDTQIQTDSIEPKADDPLINWSSVNFYYQSKTVFWYLSVLLISFVVSALIYLITRDKITAGVIMLSGIVIIIYGGRKPKEVAYQLTSSGFTVNGKFYQFSSFRSFSIIHQSLGSSAVLTPLKRFLPYTYIYFNNDLEDQISTALSDALPFVADHKDPLENFFKKIGF